MSPTAPSSFSPRGLSLGALWLVSLFAACSVHAASLPVPQNTGTNQPLERFRMLLSLSSKDRATALDNETESKRALLSKKLAEYDALTPEERELRLRATQLRAYLLPLMSMPPEGRQPQLNSVPSDLKPLIVQRLQLWDILPGPLQRDVLAYESTIHFFLRLEASPPERRPLINAALPEERRRVIEASLGEFRALSPAEQRQTFERFQGFFALSEAERQRAIDRLPSGERSRAQPALASFARMTSSDRLGLFESFQKFASLNTEQRSQFLANAERWDAMSQGERNVWRRLLTTLPPLPPGLDSAQLPLPGSRPASAPAPAPPTPPTP